MTLEKKLQRICALVGERHNVQSRLTEIDAELAEMMGEAPVRAPKAPKKPVGGGIRTKAPKAAPKAHSGAGKPCCGSKGARHMKSCPGTDAEAEEPAKGKTLLTWKCTECGEKDKSDEKPGECGACDAKTFVQV